MDKKIKEIIRKFIPPILFEIKNGKPIKYGFFGDYKNWHDVEKLSSGYSSEKIIEKVRQSALKVKNGEAVYERDSVIFDKIEISWPLLAGLLWIASGNNNKLEVIDFGGSLGTSYYQNKDFLKHLDLMHWNIVEQDKFVEIGKKEFENDVLNFFYDDELEKIVKEKKPDLMIISSSLQFLEKPFDFLERILNLNIPFLIFDKIPFFVEKNSDTKLMLQKVPPKIYDASYPVWIFDYGNLIKKMLERYKLVVDFEAYNGHTIETVNGNVIYRGFILQKNDKN